MSDPMVTVLMPVFNSAPFLEASVESILAQTFQDLELLIIDDGSTDQGCEKLRSLTDPRLRVIRQAENQGIVAALNAGLLAARGKYVARMDADDIAMPGRLARQWQYMESDSTIGLCGSRFEFFGERTGPGWVTYFEPDEIRVAMLFENPICHPTVMIRREVLQKADLKYPAEYPFAEEYALWLDLMRVTRLTNLVDTLLRYRSHPTQASQLKSEMQSRSMERVIRRQLDSIGLGSATAGEVALHQSLGGGFYPLPGYRKALERWTQALLKANDRSAYIPQDELAPPTSSSCGSWS